MFEFKNMFNSNAKKTALSVLCSFSLLTGASVTQAHAQRPEKEAPGFSPFSKRIHFYRFFEDYSDVTDQDRQGDWFAKVKSIPVPGFEGARVALGGEFRYRFENMNDGLFGLVPGQDYDLKLQRYLLHADVRWNDRLRSFFQLSAYYAQGEPAVLRSLNESDADIHQTFVDIGSREKFVRIGRQELPIGSGLNTTIREGVNQRRAFDAVLASVDFGSGSNFTWVYGREVVPMAASFEDYSEDGTEFWTAYFSRIANPWPTANVDIYYMGIDRPNAIYNSGPGRELRHAIGGGIYGEKGALSYGIEAMYQFGKFQGQDIRAWGVRSQNSYKLSETPLNPTLHLTVNATSGDSDPNDGKLETFEVFFPNPSYITEAYTLRPRNLYEVHPSFSFTPAENLKISTGVNAVWRAEKSDAIYASAGIPIVPGGTSDSRYVGTFAEITATWQANPHLFFKSSYVRGLAGDAIQNAGGRDVEYFLLQAIAKF